MKKTLFVLAMLCLTISVTAISQTCYITKSGAKYHASSCGYLKYSAIAIDLSEAIQRGYSSCSRCRHITLKNPSNRTQQKAHQNTTRNIPACQTQQCNGRTQKGKRCKNRIKHCSGYCHHHRG